MNAFDRRPFHDTLPTDGWHLLDATMFWGASGGVRRVVETRHEQLRHFGWRHTVLAPGCAQNRPADPGLLDCGGLPIPGSGGYRFVLHRAGATRAMVRAAPDIIESADPYSLAWSALAAARELQVPAVAFAHSNLPALAARLLGGVRGREHALGRWASRRARHYLVDLYRRFDAVLAPSQTLARQLRRWGVPRVSVQPLGVDCSVFRPAARDAAWRDDLCTELGLSRRTRLFVYTGRFAPEKNLPLLAEAIARLGPGHALLMVGSGPVQVRGARVFQRPCEPDRRRLARVVASCDAYVHAGDQETFGLGVLEAMACATPVVTAATGGTGELAHRVGITVSRSGAQAWADGMQAALSGVAQGLAEQALERAREHDWPLVLAQMTRRYRLLMQRHALGRHATVERAPAFGAAAGSV